MRRISLFLGLLSSLGLARTVFAFPIISYVQINPPIAPQAGGFNVSTGTVSTMTVTGLSPGQCVVTLTGGKLSTIPCGSSGGGSTAGTIVASPQFQIPYFSVPGSTTTVMGSAGLTTNGFGTLSASSVNSTIGYLQNGTTIFYWIQSSSTTAIGAGALASSPTGLLATGVGAAALQSLTSGQNNTAVGAKALQNITTAVSNTAVGANALRTNILGNSNVAIGDNALFANTSGGSPGVFGVQNTALGSSAGISNVNGANNVFIGYNANNSGGPNINNAIAIGAGAAVSSSNTMQLGGTGANAVTVNMSSMTASSATITILSVSGLAANQCVQTGTGGLLTVTGSNCSAGGGGGTSALQITQSGVQITSPTASINFAGPPFILAAVGSTTTVKLDGSSVTLQGVITAATVGAAPMSGSTNYVQLGNSLQSGSTFYVSSGTVSGSFTAGSVFINGTGAGELDLTEGAAPSGIASKTVLWADSTTHWPEFNPNNTAAYLPVGSSATVTAGHCAQFSGSGSVIDAGAACGTGGGGGTPGGSSSQVQYNNAGAFGGISGTSVSASSITYTGTVQVTTMAVNSGSGGVVDSPIKVGPNTSRGTDPGIDIARSVNNTINTGINGHAFQDSSVISRNGTIGYNSFNAVPVINGSGPFDHYAGMQSAVSYNSTNTITYIYDYLAQSSMDNSGTTPNHIDFYAGEPTINSSGHPGNNIGFYVPNEYSVGTSGNWGFYGQGKSNYMRGLILGNADTFYSSDTGPELMINADKTDANVRFFMKDNNIWDVGATSGTTRFAIKDLNATEYLTILTGGNTGIGTTAPTHKLYVNGGMAVTSSITVQNATVQSLTASQYVKTDVSKNLVSATIQAGDIPDISATYLTNSSATATYLQFSSAAATYVNKNQAASSTVLLSSGIGFGSPTNTVTQDTTSLRWNATTQSMVISSSQSGAGFTLAAYQLKLNQQVSGQGATLAFTHNNSETDNNATYLFHYTQAYPRSSPGVEFDGITSGVATYPFASITSNGGSGSGQIWSDVLYASTGFLSSSYTFTGGSPSQFVKTDASKNLVSYDLLNATQTWTARQVYSSSVTFNGNVGISSGVLLSGAAGTNGQVLTSGGAGTVPTWTTISGGGGSPGGSTTQMQYNNAGAFGGTAGLTWNGSDLNNSTGSVVTGAATATGGGETVQDNPMTSGATSVTIGGTNTNFPVAGTLIIDTEMISYTGKTATSFTGLTRGAYGTTAASHAQNAAIGVILFMAKQDSTHPGFYIYSMRNAGENGHNIYTQITGGDARVTSALFDIHSDGPSTGQTLFNVGSSNNNGQFSIVDGQAPTFNIGITAGSLNVGKSADSISSTNSGGNLLDFGGGTNTTLQSNTNDVILKPNSTEILRLRAASSVFSSSLTVTAGTTGKYEFTSSTSSVIYHVALSTSAHLITGGPLPTISSCGSTPNGSVVGTDMGGAITIGGGVVTSCVMTFSKTWGVAPDCTVTDNSTSVNPSVTSASASSITIGLSATLGGGIVYYHCQCDQGASCL